MHARRNAATSEVQRACKTNKHEEVTIGIERPQAAMADNGLQIRKQKRSIREKADVPATYLSITDAAWTQTSRSNSQRWARQQFEILKGELNKVCDVPHQSTAKGN